MELKIKLYLVDDQGEKFMGIGVLWLLQKTAALGSLRKAAADMTISYTKAFNMIARLEEALGREVLDRHKGGVERSGASLTPFGQDLIELYDGFQRKAKEQVRGPYEDFARSLEALMEENHG